MHPTSFPELNQILDGLVFRLRTVLEDKLIGAYLQGSFAVGDYDRHSDVDFIVVLEGELTSRQVDRLQETHARVYQLGSTWAQHLEGSYFPREVLRDTSRAGEDLWYLDHGAQHLIRSDHCNTLLVRWIVREMGVTLVGPPPETLLDPISSRALREEIYHTLAGWGEEVLGNPEPFRNRFYQGYLVLNYARMLHDLRRGRPGSKCEGAAWAKANLDPEWRDLIESAWDCRPDPAWQVKQPPDEEDFERTLQFVEYIIRESRRYVSRHGFG